MTVRISGAVAAAACDATAAKVDAGGSAGKLRVYSGSPPSGPSQAATGTKLLEFTLNRPAFGSASTSTGTATMDVTGLTTTGLANGTAGWFRVVDSAGTAIFDGTVPTDITLSNTAITTGLSEQITSGSLTYTAS